MFGTLTKVRNFLSGYKTYLLCAATILTVLVAWSAGDLSNLEALKALGAAIGGITLRAAISKQGVQALILALGIGLAALSFQPAARADSAGFGELVKDGLKLGLEYVASNGVPLSAGYGISADGRTKGTLLAQSISIPELEFHVHHTAVTPGIEHATLFNSKSDGPDYDLLGVNVLFDWFATPDWIANLNQTAVVKRALFFNLKEVYLQPSTDYPTDKLANLNFRWRSVFFGIKGGWKF